MIFTIVHIWTEQLCEIQIHWLAIILRGSSCYSYIVVGVRYGRDGHSQIYYEMHGINGRQARQNKISHNLYTFAAWKLLHKKFWCNFALNIIFMHLLRWFWKRCVICLMHIVCIAKRAEHQKRTVLCCRNNVSAVQCMTHPIQLKSHVFHLDVADTKHFLSSKMLYIIRVIQIRPLFGGKYSQLCASVSHGKWQ